MVELGLEAYLLLRHEPLSIIQRALEASRRRTARDQHQALQHMALSNGIETGKAHHNAPKSEKNGYYATPDYYNAELERLEGIFSPEAVAARKVAEERQRKADKKARMLARKLALTGGGADDLDRVRPDPGGPEGPGEAGSATPEDR